MFKALLHLVLALSYGSHLVPHSACSWAATVGVVAAMVGYGVMAVMEWREARGKREE